MSELTRKVGNANQIIARKMITFLNKKGNQFVSRMITQRLSGPTGPQSLSRRTGTLARNIDKIVTQPKPNTFRLTAFVRKPAFYAIVHEEGRIIRPKRARHLAIPLAAARTGAGVARPGGGGGSIRARFPDLKFIKSRAGNKLLVRIQGKGKNKRIIPMFVLKDQVRIPARLGFKKTFKSMIKGMKAELKTVLEIKK